MNSAHNTMMKLLDLGNTRTALAHGCMLNTLRPQLERGCIEAVRRYGHYVAGMMFAKAKLPIYAAVRLIGLAYQSGYQYRRPLIRK